MSSHRDRHRENQEPRRAGILLDQLRLMFEWYTGMVDENTGRLLYLYDPGAEVSVGDGELIRDIAAIWDVEVLSRFLGRDELRSLIRRSLDHFEHLIVERDGYAIVAAQREQSSIAHSAFLALALIHSQLPDSARWFAPLLAGILRQQRKNGSYKIYFEAEANGGEDLYPAEAMLAILEAYRLTWDARYLDSVERGFTHYKRDYYDRGLLVPDFLVFFANWQSQAGRLLFELTARPEVKDLVRGFLFELHDRIIASGFYDRVAHQPTAQACVEVACALEALADAYSIAALHHDCWVGDYRRCIRTALDFLVRVQRTAGCQDRERGGFGESLSNCEQGIDVTGTLRADSSRALSKGSTYRIPVSHFRDVVPRWRDGAQELSHVDLHSNGTLILRWE
jgi:hypothetical protein